MKLYIIYQVGISGWGKELLAVYKDEIKAIAHKDKLPSSQQHYYKIEKHKTWD